MNVVDQYFQQEVEKLGYLEIKEGIQQPKLKEFVGIPLPIYMKTLVGELKGEGFQDGVSLQQFIDGIIIHLAADSDASFGEDYWKLLEYTTENIGKYVLSEGIRWMQIEDERALLYFRFLHQYDLATPFSETNYGRLLYHQGSIEEKNELRMEAIRILEGVIAEEEDFPLSYYELGNIYEQEGFQLKAYHFFQKALTYLDDEGVKEEIRDRIAGVEIGAQLEKAISAIQRSDYEKALEYLHAGLRREDSGILNYYLGVVHSRIGNEAEALGYYEKALEKGANYRELFLDLSVSYYLQERSLEALQVIEEGLQLYYEDAELLYNRLVVHLAMGNREAAKVDLEIILQYGDIPEQVLENIRQIKAIYDI
ncbi:MAG: tetratricopeptide repeat protein [Tissierellia bacterium]|nr:tetratricopeptide repeat protein [Tissierellia bacterium]